MAANGGALPVRATLRLPVDCIGVVDTLRFVRRDPHVPGRSDTCMTTVRCVASSATPDAVAHAFALGRPTPNPSTRSVEIPFTLARTGPVRLAVYSAGGQRVRLLVDEVREPGAHHARWNGRDARGRLVRPGTYFVRLESAGESKTATLVRID